MNSEKANALANVAVFTPLAVYAATGRKAPPLLVAASIGIAAWLFVRDLRTLSQPEPPPLPPDVAGLTRAR